MSGGAVGARTLFSRAHEVLRRAGGGGASFAVGLTERGLERVGKRS